MTTFLVLGIAAALAAAAIIHPYLAISRKNARVQSRLLAVSGKNKS